jgi:hypothetical protein
MAGIKKPFSLTVTYPFLLQLNFWLIIISLTLIRLPVAFGYRNDFFFLHIGIIPFLAGLLINLVFLSRQAEKTRNFSAFFIFYLLFCFFWTVAFLRTALATLTLDTFFILGQLFIIWTLGGLFFLSILNVSNQKDLLRLIKAALYSFGVYVMVNLGLYLVGINPGNDFYLIKYPAQMLSLINIESSRVLFPMASGINSYGIMVGATLVGLAMLLKSKLSIFEKAMVLFFILSSLVSILLTDSRGALVFSIFTLVIMNLQWKLFRIARWIPFLVSIGAITIFTFSPQTLHGSLSFMNRPSMREESQQITGEISECKALLDSTNGVLSNRPIIWHFGIEELRFFKPIQLVGYGFRGQVISKVSTQYACLFSSQLRSNFASLHNIWLQLAFDLGYFSFLVILPLLILAIKMIDMISLQSNTLEFPALIAILLAIISMGSMEASLSPDYIELFILELFVLTGLAAASIIKYKVKVVVGDENEIK